MLSNTPLRVAVYVRVSSNDQHPENQRLELEQRIAREGWQATYFEEKESTLNTRPIKEGVLRGVLRGDYDAILVWKRERWARSLKELINDLDVLLLANRRFISHTEGLDYSTAQGKLMVHLLGSFAEFERDLIHERTYLGLDRARAQGKVLGRHPTDCGCGFRSADGLVFHNGDNKPIRNEHNKHIGWSKQTPSPKPPPATDGSQTPSHTHV
jgi:DNA invertase Pin-like site-specific DNA recombinase